MAWALKATAARTAAKVGALTEATSDVAEAGATVEEPTGEAAGVAEAGQVAATAAVEVEVDADHGAASPADR